MGVFWTDPMGVIPYDLGAPELAPGASVPCPGIEEGPDTTVVRPAICRSEAAGPYDPLPVRWYGWLGFPRTLPRTAAPVGRRREGIRDLLTQLKYRRIRAATPAAVSRAEAAPHHPEPSRSDADGHPQLLKSVS